MVLGAIGASALGFGASVGAAGATYFGQKEANKKNLQIAREQMDFQERMSNTAYRRAAYDLQQAGFNPILAARSGASTPSGASATMSNEIGPAVSSALDARRAIAEINNLNAQNSKIQADTDLSRAMREVALEDVNIKSATAKNVATQTAGLQLDERFDKSSIGSLIRVLKRLNPLDWMRK